ncbi:hypothetical protein Dform_00405 [Dehalogenimonas formicexedens]|uniref:Uncharacterized protein n=1 Tax=Dehalogenimonas formicexedens TaxID=1839801 RepID=A0A1P8F5L0_9CHLR|nr:hypothetical protein Dform_00405 [Dehalogenimonas formicexedens]
MIGLPVVQVLHFQADGKKNCTKNDTRRLTLPETPVL